MTKAVNLYVDDNGDRFKGWDSFNDIGKISIEDQ